MGWDVTLFGTTGHVNWLQESGRAILLFAYGLAAVRLVGRRVFGKWAALDIIVSVIVGSNLSRALTGSAPLFGTIVATSVLLALHWLLAQGAARWKALSRILEGSPIRLLKAGQLDFDKKLRWSISTADVEEALRGAGLEQLGAAREIVLEPSGKLNVLK
jgi:uncharacterized membrane protein YcaP (DUF421 family)